MVDAVKLFHYCPCLYILPILRQKLELDNLQYNRTHPFFVGYKTDCYDNCIRCDKVWS
jgi:hypothetical protein